MEIKEFVKSVLKDVVDAVEETRKDSHRDMHLSSGKDSETIIFDIAVTAEDTTEGSGRAGIKVYSLIEGGGEISKKAMNSSVSRIRFSVYVDRWTKAETAYAETNSQQEKNLDPYR